MTELPEPTGIVIGEERGYSDWGHVVDWKYNHHMPKGTTFYTADQMHAYGRAEYNRAIEDAAKVCDKRPKVDMFRYMANPENACYEACAKAIRALATGQQA